ncbi:MAG: Bug family tripartite tricarboxylate transporter substrate binding protein [Hydrogenophaga sp.]|jgi:tripartite-type tricarboxylate transporter receptor subunit TctC|uniref:Bug family tripartite tricarboxylate transporter substrate binding protein n=1 Tax=Hydrogenophaga sp. TaxID=1904254 RepID=UPI001E07FEB0|nr:tripartite tricarboxylate transporter substrate binding protein [Hydrogenophaga sp.]MBW0168979.1 tripartite tricarboxylate transporter substrate binding protein [Hydrogenophaga sp.]MBW0185668.1 tripartite tricarboxylate transporter substrate binding protein [Hydrogenophaga sp.]
MNTTRRLSLIACTLGLLAAAGPTLAQGAYPDKPVKLMVALPAGGGVDMIARLVGQKLAAMNGQPFVVDNRAGASGRIGLPVVAKAAPDGYTLMASPASFLTTNKHIFKEMPYDPEADFAPITKLANQSMVLVVRDRQKFPTAGAVLAAARTKPEAVNYASSGDGSPQHLAALMFETRTKVRMTHIPYKGGALAINDLLGGNVDILFAPLPEALPHVKAGKLTALAVMSEQRSALIPDVPTMRESGIDNMVFQTWIGMLAPARTPRPLVDQLNRQIHAILASEEVKVQLRDAGMDVAPTTPEQFAKTISEESRLHAELVKAAGLVPQ